MRARGGRALQLVRGHRVFAVLVGLHVLLKIALWPQAHQVAIRGDEVAYQDSGMALSNLVRDLVTFHRPDVGELQANVVSNGWFMPGPGLVTAPLYLMDPAPGISELRAYMGTVTTLLLIAAAVAVHRHLGPRFAWALLVVPGLVPTYLLFSYKSFGDLSSGLVVVLLLTRLVVAARDLHDGRRVSVRASLVIGCLTAAALYLRSSELPVVIGSLALLALGSLVLTPRGGRTRSLVAPVIASGVFVLLLLPWSWSASQTLGGRVTTTTTLPLSIAIAYGNLDDVCFGPCTPADQTQGMLFFSGVRYARELHAITGVDEVSVQKEMEHYSLRGLTPRSYARATLGDMERFALQPNSFVLWLTSDRSASGAAPWIITGTTVVLYTLAGVLFVVSMLTVARRRFDHQVRLLLLKLLGLASFVQPFVHISSGRYWPVFVPLLGLAAAAVVEQGVAWWRDARSGPADQVEVPDDGSRALTIAHWVTTASFVIIVGALLSAAA